MRRLLVPVALAAACSASIDDFLTYVPLTGDVDPMIGTRGPGNVIPGALVPHGMVKLSPDTVNDEGSIDAYEYASDRIEGFSHTHLEGPGGSYMGYSHVLVTARRGAVGDDVREYASRYTHERETAEPGYYAVTLDDAKARVELTATARCGVQRYTFEGAEPAVLLLDAAHTRGGFLDGEVRIIGNDTIQGRSKTNVHPGLALAISAFQIDRQATTGVRPQFFAAKFSRPFASFGTWSKHGVARGALSAREGEIGAFVSYPDASKAVEVRVCLSSIDEATATAALDEELGARSFDEVRTAAKEAWNRQLNRVQVEGGTAEERKVFYTALYHAHFQPTDYTEGARYWSGADGRGRVFEANGKRFYSDDWCMWDTFRTTHPLQTLTAPERRDDVVRSMLHTWEQGEWLSKCTWQATGDSRVMIANPFTPIIADADLKGFTGFDREQAWAALWKAHTEDVPESLGATVCGYFNQGTPPDYLELGYVSHECDVLQSASMTLEYAYEDWALAAFARRLGRNDEAKALTRRAGYWKNHWNPEKGFMQGRKRDGSWVEPFDPARYDADFCEASSWIYSWFVPHDVRALIEARGGPDAFIRKLDEYFDTGRHDMSNEPAFHTPFLYAYAGAPAKAQARARELLRKHFTAAPDGLPGNDDAGATSAWAVFVALGLYPITPGGDVYVLGSPVFPKATLYLEPNHFEGRTFTIEARGAGAANVYVQSAKLNGATLDRPWITHGELAKGGALVFEMGPEPSAWGASSPPPSMSDPQ